MFNIVYDLRGDVQLKTFGTLLVAFVVISRRNIMKSGEIKHEMTLFHTMGPNRNVLFHIYSFVTIYNMVSC